MVCIKGVRSGEMGGRKVRSGGKFSFDCGVFFLD